MTRAPRRLHGSLEACSPNRCHVADIKLPGALLAQDVVLEEVVGWPLVEFDLEWVWETIDLNGPYFHRGCMSFQGRLALLVVLL